MPANARRLECTVTVIPPTPSGCHRCENEFTHTSGPGTATRSPSSCGRLARRAIFRFTETPNQWLNSGRPVPTRGAVARRHERGMGCGGRESVGAQVRSQGGLNLVSDSQACKTNDVLAYGKTVWS
jgi:hypothetical protein